MFQVRTIMENQNNDHMSGHPSEYARITSRTARRDPAYRGTNYNRTAPHPDSLSMPPGFCMDNNNGMGGYRGAPDSQTYDFHRELSKGPLSPSIFKS